MKISFTTLAVASTALLSIPALAGESQQENLQPQADNQEEMIVTATRMEQSYSSTLASVTVFDRADIEKFQTQSLAEILSKAAGVSLTRSGGRGAAAGIALRGNQTDHTLFLINGVRVGSATLGSTPIELVDPQQIERIEIVRGPKSSLYGSDALGGVINIITRKANAAQPISIRASAGNNKTREASISAGQQWHQLSASFTASTISTDGFDNTESTLPPHQDDDGMEQDTFGLNLAYTPVQALTLSLNYKYSDSETEYDTDCTDSTTFASILCSPYSETTVEVAQLAGAWQINKVWNSRLSVSHSKNESEEFADEIDITTTFSGGIFDTKKQEANWQNDFQLAGSTVLSIGYDYLNEKVSGSTAYDVSERENDAVYLQLQWRHNGFSSNLGARSDDNEQFGSHDTYTATFGYEFSHGFKVIASYGEAFKAPTFNDLYYPDFGDPSLVPEESDTYELAIQQTTEQFDWAVRGYKNNVENLIQYNAAIFANDQIGSATIEGLEITLGTQFLGIDASLAVTLLDTEDDATGNELARRPQQVINLDLDRQFNQWSIGASFYAASSRYNDAANNLELAGYGTVAVRGAYSVNEQWTLQLKADNIFEKDYFISSGRQGLYRQPGLEVLFSVVYTPDF